MDPFLPQAQHGLHFTAPVEVWDEALPLGNGLLGALVWGAGQPLKISLDRTDLWDLRLVPEFNGPDYTCAQMRRWHATGRHEDLMALYEKPYHRPAPTKIPAGRLELQFGGTPRFVSTALTLLDAQATVDFAQGIQVRVFVHAFRPVGMIRVCGAAPTPHLRVPPFAGQVSEEAQGGIGAGDLGQLGYLPAEERQGEGFQSFCQHGAEGFSFAVYLGWRAEDDTWLGAWSITSSFDRGAPRTLARQQVDLALAEGFESLLAEHAQWWAAYWKKSSLQVPDEILQRQWYLDQYKFGAASRRGAPPITLQGPWTADDGKLPPWKGDYHHDLNTQLSYWPCYSGNHLEEGLNFLDWLWETRPACFDWTRRFFGLPGLNVPMTADLGNNQIGGWRQYTHSATTAAWLAHHFYLHWKFSADPEFLRRRAYPYLRDAAVFIEAITAERDSEGRRSLPLSASPEINDNRPEAWFAQITNYDLALCRWLLGAAAELAGAVGRTEEAARWRQVLSEFPDLALGSDGQLLVVPGEALQASHRHFSHLMAIHPLGLIDPEDGEAAQRTIRASLQELERLGTDWWTGYSFSWLACLAARARDGEQAARALRLFATAFCLCNSFHCNGDQSGQGLSRFTYRPFTLEGNFAAAAGLQEMLLQSHRGKIRIFPAIPASWQDVAFTDLRAEGAFLVSAWQAGGKVLQVEIHAEQGGRCVLVSPFSGREITLQLQAGERRTLSADPA
ncbi:MAG: glycoside hydrolase N-terminal domain-containing protein [Candidatus Latescibacteria bacterium]|nr:glycoside hydrolase N-terminal domain-containing protein [Candidatus Latescibacterota bacterium]